MCKIIAVANQKGGVGKTTTVMNLGAALSELGQRVLLIDLDPQGSLTICCGYEPDRLERTIYDALKNEEISRDILLTTKFGMDLLPANLDLSLIEMELVDLIARERRLTSVLIPFLDEYDVILLDCQPSLGLLTLNALTAADEIIIPIACEYLALRGVQGLLKLVKKVKLQLNSKLKIRCILPTMFDRRTKHSQEVLTQIKEMFYPKIDVFPDIVYRSVRFAESAAASESILNFARSIPGADAYRSLARSFIES